METSVVSGIEIFPAASLSSVRVSEESLELPKDVVVSGEKPGEEVDCCELAWPANWLL